MKKLSCLLFLFVASFAHTSGCHLQGVVRLAPPYNAVLCRVNNVPRWEVGYAAPYNAFLVTNELTGDSWLLPVRPLKRYSGVTVTGEGASSFVLKSMAFEDDQRVPVELEGN